MEGSFMLLKICASVFCFILSLYGLFNYMIDQENNMCNMTYMFEYPEYIKIPLRLDLTKKYPRYDLYAYGEGRYAQELRNNRLSGIPVLFIPGNAGSHRQVRSIASVALRMGHSLRSSFHFNFFASSFKEELSGFYGSILEEQTEFIRECVQTIQQLYTQKKKLIIIGHSMGGILARALFSAEYFDPSSVSIIFTLAAPHKQPVIALDHAFVDFYKQIHKTWITNPLSDLVKIPVISVGGGQRDVVVKSALTVMEPRGKAIDFHVLTTSIPGVWVSTDHLAIVWCKQLVLTLSRAMFDLIDDTTKEVSANTEIQRNILHHHFIQRSYDGHFSKLRPIQYAQFSYSGEWIEEKYSSWRLTRSKVLTTIYVTVPIKNNENAVFIASGLVKLDWVFGCLPKNVRNSSQICEQGISLSSRGKIIPRKNGAYERRMVLISSSMLKSKDVTHVVIRIEAMNSEIDILGECYKREEREKHIFLPSFPERLFTFTPVRIMNFLLADRAVFYNLTVSGFGRVVDSVTFYLETRICKAGSLVGQGIVNVHIPWSHEDNFYQIRTTLGGMTAIPVKIHTLPPRGVKSDIQLHIILDPECSYTLFVTYPMSNIISQFMKFYGLHIISYVVALMVCVLSGQLYAFGVKGTCVSSVYILGKYPTYLSLVMMPAIMYHGMSVIGFQVTFLPVPDEIMEDAGFHHVVALRSVLYIIAYGIVLTINFIFEKSISLISLSWICIKKKAVIQVTERPLVEARDQLKISYFNIFISSILQTLAVGLAGSLAVMCGFFYQFIKLVKMCVRCQAEEERRGPSIITSKWRFHIALTILWSFAGILTLPGTITWAKHLDFSLHLVNDPHTLPCIILIMSVAFIWQLPVPCSNRMFYRATSHIIRILSSLIVLYAMKSLYRLFYFITLIFLIVNVHQVVTYVYGLRRKKTD